MEEGPDSISVPGKSGFLFLQMECNLVQNFFGCQIATKPLKPTSIKIEIIMNESRKSRSMPEKLLQHNFWIGKKLPSSEKKPLISLSS